MKNYISTKYYETRTVYASREKCIEVEGDAIEFDGGVDLDLYKISEGELVEDTVALEEKGKRDRNSDKYNIAMAEIYDEMEVVFGTRNDITAAATALTYEAMLKRPNNYIDEEIGFSTKTDVENYAKAKLDEYDKFGLFRMKRIAKYKKEKEN